jgi:hypothetical protein
VERWIVKIPAPACLFRETAIPNLTRARLRRRELYPREQNNMAAEHQAAASTCSAWCGLCNAPLPLSQSCLECAYM